ncbi:MAG: tetratricopeptide repeat protein [Acidobacteria bacterium]|nr:tetratricopeptide repeat protein [Acidobacteriota bacterium]
MPRVLILAVVLAAGLPVVAQTPASDPPPSSTATSNSEQPPPEENAQANQTTTRPGTPEEPKKDEKKKGKLGRLKDHVKDHLSTGCVGAGTAGGCWGDDDKDKKDGKQESAEKNPSPPRSDESDPEFSSSRDTQVDLSPPGQEKPTRTTRKAPDDVQELKRYDPHAAEKDIEVGEYYLKTGNLKGAIARFRWALENKPNDALATFRLAQALEKAGQLENAREYYGKYLQILPKGEFAAECQKALQRLPAPPSESAEAAPPTSAPAETPPSKR